MSDTGVSPDTLLDEGDLICCICLELFTNPLTLSCGHSCCQKCIHEHFDQEEGNRTICTCPECRKEFPQRPEPSRNVILCAIVEKLKKSGKQRHPKSPVLLKSQTTVPGTLCSRHNHPLDMFCCSEKRCICRECIVKECHTHSNMLMLIEAKRQQEQEQLCQAQDVNTNSIKQTEEKITKHEQLGQKIKATCDKLVSGTEAEFDQLSRILEECRLLTKQAIKQEEVTSLGRVEESLGQLRSYLTTLQQFSQEVKQLLQNPDHAIFLQQLALLASPESAPTLPDIPFCCSAQVEAVTRILPEVKRLLQVELPNALHPCMPETEAKDTRGAGTSTRPKQRSDPYVMSEMRSQLFKEYHNLTFDIQSANKYIQVSRNGCEANHTRISVHNVPELQEQFNNWQVMCTDGFHQGRHYWEVEISDFFVHVGVAYGSLSRNGGDENKIGHNRFSWSLQILSTRHSVWHDNKEEKLQMPKYKKIGVSLDYNAGSLIYYGIKDGKLNLLHSFSCTFSEVIYPIFWIGEGASVVLCQVS
ncbi:tripartite motif-containing protein 65 [Bombina bombina]|uniref:tripartite motif-containing protein 65 n=1 Tax=Bombina bombina TaxID=8345 RepID=UPI00235A8719|nr:tripartite motif-containing protein 65 [Bombina bombina]